MKRTRKRVKSAELRRQEKLIALAFLADVKREIKDRKIFYAYEDLIGFIERGIKYDLFKDNGWGLQLAPFDDSDAGKKNHKQFKH